MAFCHKPISRWMKKHRLNDDLRKAMQAVESVRDSDDDSEKQVYVSHQSCEHLTGAINTGDDCVSSTSDDSASVVHHDGTFSTNHLSGRLRNSTAILTAYIFRMKHDTDRRDNRASALTTTRGPLHRLKRTCTLIHKRLQTGPPLLPTLRKF